MCRSRVERMTLGKLCVSQTSRSWIDYRQQAAAAAWECLSHIRNESVVEIWYEMGWWRNMRIEQASTAARRKKATEREPTTPITFFPNERSQISLLYTKGVKLSTIFLGVKKIFVLIKLSWKSLFCSFIVFSAPNRTVFEAHALLPPLFSSWSRTMMNDDLKEI